MRYIKNHVFRRVAEIFLTVAITLCAAIPAGRAWGASYSGLVYNGNFNTASTGATDVKKNRPEGWSQFVIPDGYTNAGAQPGGMTQIYHSSGSYDGSAYVEVGNCHANYTTVMWNDDDLARYQLDKTYAISASPAQYYKFTVMYKTSGVEGSQAEAEVDMFNGTTFIDANIYSLPAAAGWTQFTACLRTISAADRGFGQLDTTKIRIKLGLASSAGTVSYDDAYLAQIDVSEYNANLALGKFTPAVLKTRRQQPHWMTAKGVYSLQQDGNGAWWFVTPEGKPFWWRAVQFPKVRIAANPVLFNNLSADMKDVSISNGTYSFNCLTRLGALGFNAEAVFDGGTILDHPKGQGHFEYLPIDDYPSAYLLKDKNGNADSSRKPMPDPYNPNFQTYIRDYIRTDLDDLDSNSVGNKDFAGYFTDNEMGDVNLDKFIWSSYCEEQFIAFIKSRYSNSISAVNAAWNSDPNYYTSFALTGFTASEFDRYRGYIVRYKTNGALNVDLDLFVRQMLKDYYKLICGVIREYECDKLGDVDGDGISERKHIIATNRFDLAGFPNRFTPETQRAMDVIGQLAQERPGYYFDVVAVNNYPGDGFYYGGYSSSNLSMIEDFSSRTGLPVMVSEFGVGGNDSGIVNGNNVTGDVGWFYRSVATQAERGQVYQKYVTTWADSPYIAGAQWFCWGNIYYDSSNTNYSSTIDTNSSHYIGRNSGVVNNKNELYTDLTDSMASTHAALDAAFAPIITAPSAPAVRSELALYTYAGYPTWTWSSSGNGNGTFRYQLNSTAGEWTVTTSTRYWPESSLSNGTHTLYVEESNAAGVWSSPGSYAVTIAVKNSAAHWSFYQ